MEEQTSYKLLSFLFDGVPVPASMQDSTIISVDSTMVESARQDSGKTAMGSLRHKPKKIEYYYHKPYQQRQCNDCHSSGSGQSLVMPLDQLCGKCHGQFMSPHKYVHGPVAVGQCLVCHHPHSALYPKLTIKPGNDLCLQCHNNLKRTKVHSNILNDACIDCHSPHYSDSSKFFLNNP